MFTPRLFVADLIACLRFYTRLPIPALALEAAPHELRDFSRAIRLSPLAGAIIGAIGALALGLAHAARFPASVCAGLALATLLLTTGVFHEDGLADAADGLGGGASVERKLEIMKDSRIGSYGAAALGMSLLLRYAAVSALTEADVWRAMAALVAAGSVSRACGLAPLSLLAPARKQGAAFAGAGPTAATLATAGMIALCFALGPLVAGASAAIVLASLVAAIVAALTMTAIAWRQIGGQTGDIAGAAQQVAEIALLCVLSMKA